MKPSPLLPLLLLVAMAGCRQSDPQVAPSPGKILARAELNHKYGCIDTTGHEVVPLRYDDMGFWASGRIAVNVGAKVVDYLPEGGKWGYCNEEGELVIPLQFDKAGTFNEGLAGVKKDGKWGFIDTSGKMIIEPRFEDISVFKEGLCAVMVNKQWGYVNPSGEMVIRPAYVRARAFEGGAAEVYFGDIGDEENGVSPKGGYGLINKEGRRLTDTTFAFIGNWSEGLVEVKDKNEKVGFIDRKGRIVVPLIYDIAEEFSQGRAAVGRLIPSSKKFDIDRQYRYSYINAKGDTVIKGPFDIARGFENGYAVVGKGRQLHGFIFAYRPSDGLLTDSALYPRFALIDTAGNFILDYKWGGLGLIDSGRLFASRSGYYGEGVIDMKARTLIPFKYTNLDYLGKGLFAAGSRDQAELIDSKGDTLIRTDSFAMPAPAYEYGLLHVRTNKFSKSGFVDVHGRWIIRDKYDMVWSFGSTRPDTGQRRIDATEH